MTDLTLLMWAFKYHNDNQNKRVRGGKIDRDRDRNRWGLGRRETESSPLRRASINPFKCGSCMNQGLKMQWEE